MVSIFLYKHQKITDLIIFTLYIYIFKTRLLPKAISLYLKYKYRLNVKIGTAGIFSLQDIIFLKNGYSVVQYKNYFTVLQNLNLSCLTAYR